MGPRDMKKHDDILLEGKGQGVWEGWRRSNGQHFRIGWRSKKQQEVLTCSYDRQAHHQQVTSSETANASSLLVAERQRLKRSNLLSPLEANNSAMPPSHGRSWLSIEKTGRQ